MDKRLKLLEEDKKILLDSNADIINQIKILKTSSPDKKNKIGELMKIKRSNQQMVMEIEDEILGLKENIELSEGNKDIQKKNDNYSIVRASYIKINNDQN